MAPTPAPASTFTDTGRGSTHVDAYPDHTYTNYNLSEDPTTVVNNNERTATPAWVIVVAVISTLVFIVVVIVYFVYFHRQRKGKPLDLYAEPSPLPGGGGAPLMAEFHGAPNVYNQPSDMYSEGPNTYIEVAQSVYNQPSVLYSERPNAYSEVAQSVYNATRNAYPPPPTRPRWYSGHVQSPFTIREGHEYAYGTTAPYSNAMGMTGYTGASYHAETSIPPTPPLQPMSPQPQTLARHSQYTSTSSAFEPYGAPSVSNTPQGVYCWIG